MRLVIWNRTCSTSSTWPSLSAPSSTPSSLVFSIGGRRMKMVIFERLSRHACKTFTRNKHQETRKLQHLAWLATLRTRRASDWNFTAFFVSATARETNSTLCSMLYSTRSIISPCSCTNMAMSKNRSWSSLNHVFKKILVSVTSMFTFVYVLKSQWLNAFFER